MIATASNGPRTVLVLGGKGAIGSAIGDRFELGGYDVIRHSRSDFDLTKPEEITGDFSRVHVLIHSAGHNKPKSFADLTEGEVRESVEANVFGFLEVLRRCAAVRRIVAVSSIYGFLGRTGRLPYVLSKHALVGVVRSLAVELGPSGVLVNAVSPGYIDTALTRRNNDERQIRQFEESTPLRRMGTPQEVAEAVYFLGSDKNTFITGHDLVIDGGFTVDGG